MPIILVLMEFAVSWGQYQGREVHKMKEDVNEG
jgi:hypothetical protein